MPGMKEVVLAAIPGDDTSPLCALYDVSTFDELCRIGRASKARTWGEFRDILGVELFVEVTEHWERVIIDPSAPRPSPQSLGFDDGNPDFELWLEECAVSPGDPFCAMEMPGYNEGDLPDVFGRALSELPASVIESYGEWYNTIFNGSAVVFPLSLATEVSAALAAHDLRVVRVVASFGWVYGDDEGG